MQYFLTLTRQILFNQKPASRRLGSALIELVLVIFLIGSALVTGMGSFSYAQKLSRRHQYRATADSLASEELERLRLAGYAALAAAGSHNLTAAVAARLNELPSAQGQTVITQYDTNLKQLAVTISWRPVANLTNTDSITLTTVLGANGLKP